MLNQSEDGLAAGTDYDTSSTTLLEKDRISGLPDEILGHILSQLWTTQAVQTSILSKRWKHAWTNISCVRLSITRHGEIINRFHGRYSTMPGDLLFPSFFNFVDEILKYFCHGPGRGLFREFIYVDLQTLAEETAYDERIMSHIRDALCCDIEHLKLEPRRGTILRAPLPNSLLVTSPSLRVLDWNALLYPWFPFYREIPAEPTFIALRELTLRGIIFNILSSMGAEVFLGCPNLETLVLYKCWMVKCDDGELEINIPSLIKLVIHHPYLLSSGTLIVASTPRLACFKYLGCHPLVCCVRNNNMPFDEVEMDTEGCPNSCPNSGKNLDIMILIDAIRELCRARSFRLCKKILNKLLLETSGIAKESLLKEAKSQECSQWFYITAELQRLIREAGISPLAHA